MNDDDRLLLDVRSWLKDEDVVLPDAEQAGRLVAAGLPQTRQLRRKWWPLLSFRGTSVPPRVIPDTEYQAITILATNGHSPTVTGRTQSMLSPVKAITASALVFAIGSAFLIAQPFGQQGGGVPGATTDAGAAAPVAVTATNAPGGCSAATAETLEGVISTRGRTCSPSWTWSDERLNGAVTLAHNSDLYLDGSGLTVGTRALSIKNDEGGWRMRSLPQVDFLDAPEAAAEVWILDGEGAYEGLTVVLLVDDWEPHGFIIDGSLPPPPENASTK